MGSGPKRLWMICEKSANYYLIGTCWTSDKKIKTVAFEQGSHARRKGENGHYKFPFSQAPALSRGACYNASKLCNCLVDILCCRSLTCDSPPPSITSHESLAVSSQPTDTWYQAIPEDQAGEVTQAPEYPECFTTYRRITHFVEYFDVAEVSSRFEVNWTNFFT